MAIPNTWIYPPGYIPNLPGTGVPGAPGAGTPSPVPRRGDDDDDRRRGGTFGDGDDDDDDDDEMGALLGFLRGEDRRGMKPPNPLPDATFQPLPRMRMGVPGAPAAQAWEGGFSPTDTIPMGGMSAGGASAAPASTLTRFLRRR